MALHLIFERSFFVLLLILAQLFFGCAKKDEGAGGGGSEAESAPSASCGSPTALISQTAGNSQTSPSSLHPMVQSFTVAETKRIAKVTLTYKKSVAGSANLNVYVAIYAGGVASPDFAAQPLTTVTTPITVNALTQANYDFAFPTQPTLSPGTTYWIYALPSSVVHQIYSNASVYANGVGLYYDGGVPNSWSNNPGAGDPIIGDLLFQVWTCD